MRFVALDLETTGLSPETDTIIEVAAVSFNIEKAATGRYEATNIVEHSQLVYPEREMTEEISMITGITDAMLEGKPTWRDVRDKVMQFIGDESVIVGHNVLFDVAMFATHDIDLSSHPILDTFELSEILSQEAESLNLGFLAGMYGLSAGDKEHRALGDTRLSVGLFVHYLNQVETLSDEKKSIFTLAGKKETKPNLGLFAEVAGIDVTAETNYALVTETKEQDLSVPLSLHSRGQEQGNQERILHPKSTSILRSASKGAPSAEGQKAPPTSYTTTSLPLGRDSEGEFLQENIKKGDQSSIGVFGYVQTSYMKTLLEELGYQSEIYRAREEYISIDELQERVVRGNWRRKESILITKLLYWLEDTQTGLLKELKLYGEEREEIAFFRMQEGETNTYYTQLQESLDTTDVIIYDMTRHIGNLVSTTTKTKTLILKDIPLLEESMRRSHSVHISIEKLVKSLGEFEHTESLIERIRFIEAMYLEFPVRPTGPEVSPPGGYGETYFVAQSDIWHRGCVNLSLITNSLLEAYSDWVSDRVIQTHREQLLARTIGQSIEGLISFHRVQDTRGAIIEIQHNCLSISIVPRDVRTDIMGLLSTYSHTTLYSTGIRGTKLTQFLGNETGLVSTVQGYGEEQEEKHLIVDSSIIRRFTASGELGGTVILTTSAKHIREIGRSLEKTGHKILMQGISGGKGKQLGLFRNNPAGTVLIGTIDMWREELELWNHAKHIIIAKLPFDPPTDAYFLVRTVGMKNNFSLYSEPMLIIKVNTLLTRIYSSEYTGMVYCEDGRLTETIWGKELLEEIV